MRVIKHSNKKSDQLGTDKQAESEDKKQQQKPADKQVKKPADKGAVDA